MRCCQEGSSSIVIGREMKKLGDTDHWSSGGDTQKKEREETRNESRTGNVTHDGGKK